MIMTDRRYKDSYEAGDYVKYDSQGTSVNHAYVGRILHVHPSAALKAETYDVEWVCGRDVYGAVRTTRNYALTRYALKSATYEEYESACNGSWVGSVWP